MEKRIMDRVQPRDVGVSAEAVKQLFESLDCEATEPHGLMMVRHGKVFAEGYWKPYAAGVVHGMQSLSKTYAGTAIGIAMQKKLLELDDPAILFFPELSELSVLPYVKMLSIRHILSMSTGMRKTSGFNGNWVYHFFCNPIIDRPGTRFFYNSVGSTLLGEIIRRVSGETLNEFLQKNLYEKIGMQSQGIKWLCLPDGMEIGGSGLYSSLDNNTLLGMLYLNHGSWNGEQIIHREFCHLASTSQIENWTTEGVVREGEAGYGFQLWMGLHRNTYCMCGAMGQYTIMCPDEDMVISFSGRTEDAVYATSETVLEKFWKFLETGLLKKNEEESKESGRKLEKYLARLSLPSPPCCPYGSKERFVGDWKIGAGEFDLDMTTGGIMHSCFAVHPISRFTIMFEDGIFHMCFINDSGKHILQAGLDGIPRLNKIITPPFPCSKVIASAAFDGDQLIIYLRWIETCYSARLILKRDGRYLKLEKIYDAIDPSGNLVPHCASAFRC